MSAQVLLFGILVGANLILTSMQTTVPMALVFAGAAIINLGLFANALY